MAELNRFLYDQNTSIGALPFYVSEDILCCVF